MNDSPMPDALMHFFVFDVGVAVLFVFTLVRRSLCLESSSQDKIGRQPPTQEGVCCSYSTLVEEFIFSCKYVYRQFSI